MKKYISLMILIVSLLTACNVREPVYERHYPDTSSLEIARVKRDAEIKLQEQNTVFDYLIDSSTPPKDIAITVTEPKSDLDNEPTTSKYQAFALQYCWSKTYEECADIKPVNMYTYVDVGRDDRFVLTAITVAKASHVEFKALSDSGKTPKQDRFELYLLERNGEITPYPLNNINGNNYSFKLLDEVNTYYFVVKAIFEEYIGGVSYYMLRIVTK